jgi:hypothetical protein
MKDFIIDSDLEIANGDFAIKYTNQQNIKLLFLTPKGSFPVLSVGISKNINSLDATSRIKLENEIDKQLSYDEFFAKNITCQRFTKH